MTFFRPDYRKYPDMGRMMSDPKTGDEEFCECTQCSRPTKMTGTKLCDRCWNERQSLDRRTLRTLVVLWVDGQRQQYDDLSNYDATRLFNGFSTQSSVQYAAIFEHGGKTLRSYHKPKEVAAR